jgi:predicted AlkP superfamily pyrophosphatase or phosphodiesterase
MTQAGSQKPLNGHIARENNFSSLTTNYVFISRKQGNDKVKKLMVGKINSFLVCSEYGVTFCWSFFPLQAISTSSCRKIRNLQVSACPLYNWLVICIS